MDLRADELDNLSSIYVPLCHHYSKISLLPSGLIECFIILCISSLAH